MTEQTQAPAAYEHDWLIARGQVETDPAAPGRMIRGTVHDRYGRGCTMVRRVYRAGEWQWVSRLASPPQRYLDPEHQDIQYGLVRPGEIIAQGVLGGASPEGWWLMTSEAGAHPLMALRALRHADGIYALSLPGCAGTVLVPEPRLSTDTA